jgi:succinylglutamic semialdehyde dehydrogenase
MSNLSPMTFKGNYINGEFIKLTSSHEDWAIQSPSDVNDTVIEMSSNYDQIEQACASAKKAFSKWAHLGIEGRKPYLLKLKQIFNENQEAMAQLIARETGKPLWESKTEAAALSSKIDITIEHSLKLIQEEKVNKALLHMDGYIRYKPRGVMAVLGPFNFPAHLPNGHIIPALIAGNTIVYKPSDKTPAVGQFYADLFDKADLPDGVFNLVQGRAEVGKRLVQSSNVDGILFTGSYDVGLQIKKDTIEHYWKILALEMGGKNSTIVWQDADLEKAVYESVIGAFMSSGQRCSCTSKIIVHPKIKDKFVAQFHAAAKRLSIGHWSENPFMGPLIDKNSVDKYLRFQEIAKREGADSIMHGKVLETKYKGNYVTPSIYLINKINFESVYQKTEIFGPNVAIYTTDDFDQAVEIVNASGFGLAAALFSKDKTLYEKALIDARVGLLNWNRTTNGSSSRLPFGGMGKSGNDRSSGHFAIQYCAVPVASLEDEMPMDKSKVLPGMNYEWVT